MKKDMAYSSIFHRYDFCENTEFFTNVVLEPQDLGLPLQVKVAMQINIVLSQDDNLNFAKNLTKKDLYIPSVYFLAVRSN